MARERSDALQRQLRDHALLDPHTTAAALRWQLRQSGTFDEADTASCSRAAAANGNAAHTWAAGGAVADEHGMLLFAAEVLEP